MKVYLASRFARRPELEAIASRFARAGVEVTSRWLTDPNHRIMPDDVDSGFNATLALEDLQDVDAADVVVLFTDGLAGSRGGCHVEFGYALAKGKRLAVVGPRTNVFTWLDDVECFDSAEGLLVAL